jgi:hypothetical protein
VASSAGRVAKPEVSAITAESGRMLHVQEPFTAESAEPAEPYGVLCALGGLCGERLWAPVRLRLKLGRTAVAVTKAIVPS